MSKQNKAKSNKFEQLAKKSIAGLKKGTLTFNDLDFTNPFDVFVAKGALQANVALMAQLDQNDANQLNVMLVTLATNTKGILYVTNPNEKVLSTYVQARLAETAIGQQDVTVLKSFDNKPLLNISYASHEGETIAFFDEKLSIPNVLKASAQAQIKVEDAKALVNKIDVSLEYFNAQLLTDTVSSIITDAIRAELLLFVKENGITYFDLAANYGKISAKVIENANATLADYGIVLKSFVIGSIDTLNDAHAAMENQYFAIATDKCWKAYQNEMQAAALVNYEKKAEIHNKYPEFAATLTEEEKDLALNRYLAKNGKETRKALTLQKAIAAKRQKKAIAPVGGGEKAPFSFGDTRKKGFLKRFIFFLVVFVGASIFLLMQGDAMQYSQTLGFALLAVTSILFGTILAFKYPVIRGTKGRPQEDFNTAYAKYLNDVANKKANITLEEVSVKESENE